MFTTVRAASTAVVALGVAVATVLVTAAATRIIGESRILVLAVRLAAATAAAVRLAAAEAIITISILTVISVSE